MLEESISCSPGKDRNHSRSRRFHKKATRRSQRLSGPPVPQSNVLEEVSFMDALYDNSTHPTGPALDQYNYFNPFENARIIAAADKAQPSTSKSKPQLLSQGFVKLEQLPLRENDFFAEPLPSISNPKPATVTGAETQFGITESEFVRFCDEAEFDINIESPAKENKTSKPVKSIVEEILNDFCESPTAKEIKTPKPAKSIVEQILNDFCGSPYSESPPKFLTDDSTPVFRFKSKSLRTYSRLRKQKSRRNIVSELANVNLPDDDSNTSNSSGLSIQEDLSPYIVPQLNTVDLNNSIKVCENLLNLSLHFSQVSSHVKSSPEGEEKCPKSTPTIQDEIIQMRRKPFTILRSKSPDEFHGFSDVDDEEDTLKELLKDEEDDVLKEINCDSLCYEKVVLRTSETWNNEADKADLDMQKEDFDSGDGIYDNSRDNFRGASHHTLQQEEELFDDLDLWSDSECLLNYKTQNPQTNRFSPIEKLSRVSEFNEVGIMSTAAAETKQREREFLDQPSTSSKYSTGNGIKIPQPGFSSFLGFSTASKKSIAISDEAQRKANAIIAEFERAEVEQGMKDELDVPVISAFPCVSKKLAGISYHATEKAEDFVKKKEEQLVGYSTGSRKPILTSVDPKRKANQNLENFEQERHSKKMKETAENIPETSAFVGFLTASQKPIAISAGAKRKAVEILERFDQEERDKCMSGGEAANIPNFDPFVGFKTASRKPIAISNEAKRKASAILENFENEERDKIADDVGKDVTPPGRLFVGFSTASRKPIAISDESKRKANAIMEKFESAERDKLAEDAENDVTPFVPTTDVAKRKATAILGNVGIAGNVKNIGTTSVSSLVGHSMASKERISPPAEREANTIPEQFKNDERANQVKTNATPTIFVGFSTASRKPIAISDQAKRKATAILEKFEKDERDQISEEVKNDASPSVSTFVGFSTASKKPIAISDEAKCKADVLLKKFQQDEEVAAKIKIPDEISDEAKKKAEELLMDIEFFTEAFDEELSTMDQQNERHEPAPTPVTNNPPFEAFKTASNKRIQVSDAAKQHANQLLSQVDKEGLSQDFLKCIDADLQVFSSRFTVEQAANKWIQVSDVGKQHTNQLLNQEEKEGLSQDFLKCIDADLQVVSSRSTVEQASNKRTEVSEVGKQHAIDADLQVFPKRSTVDEVDERHTNLAKQQKHMHAPATPYSSTNPMNDQPHRLAVPHLPGDIESDSQEYATTDENSLKRKRTQFYTDDLHKSPMQRSPLRLSCSEQTPIHHNDNAVLHKTSSMPQIKPTPRSAFISRKNLLSLSKRKKFNSPRTIGDVTNGSKTPEKMSSQDNANGTPNLKEFFNSVSTSTPRLIRNNDQHEKEATKNDDTSIDSDFRQINWDEGSTSVRGGKISSIGDLNAGHADVSPSPKQRIERLKMYGEPPPISPILLVNKCRPSGLRRGRSRMKS